jgi:hypothetical protein
MASKEEEIFMCGYFSCCCGMSRVGCGPRILNCGSRMRVVGWLDPSVVSVCYGVIKALGLCLPRYSGTLEDDALLSVHDTG